MPARGLLAREDFWNSLLLGLLHDVLEVVCVGNRVPGVRARHVPLSPLPTLLVSAHA